MNLQEISKATISFVTEFPNELTGKIVKMALASMQPTPQPLLKPLEKLSLEKNIPKEQLYDLLSIYIAIIKQFIRTSDKDFISNLVEIGFPNEFVEGLPFVNNRKELVDTFFAPHYAFFQNVSSIKWRIDISLFNSSLLNKTPPNIILSIKLKNGKLHTIELNPKAFHMMRFNIALILKEMKSFKLNDSINKMIK
ncbi:unnamed protein product [Ceutorhynchus assimilis]|uniref:COMM domain-containing protein 5 n=1 Tax=Ceutorhynchus assimilis TaxID=467358 RepID=A0A9N9MEZ5_9CUCU|nr:unnamed protein product [Ceutorhynchus assimilis]